MWNAASNRSTKLMFFLLSIWLVPAVESKCSEVIEENILNCNENETGDICSFQCKEGFHSNVANVTCLPNGEWDVQPECKQIQCPSVKPDTAHSIACEAANYSTICHPRCEDGYWYQSNNKLSFTCNSTGWTPTVNFTCIKIFKDVEDSVAWEGDGNFYIIFPIPYRVYLGDLRFDIEVITPSGERKPFKKDVQTYTYFYYIKHEITVEDGGLYIFVITVRQDNGYSYVWKVNSTVTIRGPSCSHLSIADGEATCAENNFQQTVCNFTCNEGYRLNGSSSLNCSFYPYRSHPYVTFGEWRNVPDCQPIGLDHFYYDSKTVNKYLGVVVAVLAILNIGIFCRNRKINKRRKSSKDNPTNRREFEMLSTEDPANGR